MTTETPGKSEPAEYPRLLLLVKKKIWFRAEAKAKLDSPYQVLLDSTACPHCRDSDRDANRHSLVLMDAGIDG